MRLEYKGWMTPAAVGVISFAAGAGAGYFFKKYRDAQKVDTSFQEVADDIIALETNLAQLQFMYEERDRKYDVNIQQAMHVITALQDAKKEFILGINEAVGPTVSQPVDIQHVDSHPSAKNKQPKQSKPHVKAQAKPKVVVNDVEDVFPVNEDEDWNYEEELKTRRPDRPYIIHRDEFFSNENDYRQCSLMYYAGDSILCDENDVPVYNPERIVGELRFGHGSGDPSIVYSRNEKLEAEYEIILDDGYYQTEVLGHEVEHDFDKNELKHSVQKFRATD